MGDRLGRCGFPRPAGSGASIRAYGPVDYAPIGAVDYDAAHLWISQHVVLGRIYPHLSVLWISRFAGRAELAIDVSVRRSGEEDGTHGTVADGTKGHKRQRDTLAEHGYVPVRRSV